MKKFVIPVIVLICVVFIYIAMPSFGDAIEGFRTDSKEYTYSTIVTAASTTNTSQILQYALFDNDVAYVTEIESDLNTDNPIASTYTSATKTLLITGLDDDASRNLTVTYETAALDDYEGADEFASLAPLVIMAALILIALASVVAAIRAAF